MKDERAHLQLFDLIAREWHLPSPARGVVFNASGTTAAFDCGDGSVHLAATADRSSSSARVRRAIDDGRMTIAPRDKPVAPLKIADFTTGRASPVVPLGPLNFAFGLATGRLNTLTPGGIAGYMPARADGPVTSLAASPDGTTLAFACGAEVLLAPTGTTTTTTITAPSPVTAIAFSADGQQLAVGHAAGVTIHAIGEWRDPAPIPLPAPPESLHWSADGKHLLARLGAGGITLYTRATGTARTYPDFPSPVRAAAFSQPAAAIVAAGAYRVAGWSLDAMTSIVTGKPGLLLIDSVAASPTRDLVAVGYSNGLISLAEIGRPAEMLLREDTGASVTAMAWSPDGRFLAIAGSDGSAALVDFPDGMFKP